MTSVLKDWVMELPLRAQGTLLTGIRGCDLAPKNPCDINERYGCSTGESTPERHLAAYLRFCCLNTPDEREIGMPGAWIQPRPPTDWKPSQFGHYRCIGTATSCTATRWWGTCIPIQPCALTAAASTSVSLRRCTSAQNGASSQL